ncbi:hypothetical protein FKP32DRAFT_828334 [Trametes sanguinea]|nr:hypothetical protein FKP32DRAFT_828334 [Trametes sanguinea]
MVKTTPELPVHSHIYSAFSPSMAVFNPWAPASDFASLYVTRRFLFIVGTIVIFSGHGVQWRYSLEVQGQSRAQGSPVNEDCCKHARLWCGGHYDLYTCSASSKVFNGVSSGPSSTRPTMPRLMSKFRFASRTWYRNRSPSLRLPFLLEPMAAVSHTITIRRSECFCAPSVR